MKLYITSLEMQTESHNSILLYYIVPSLTFITHYNKFGETDLRRDSLDVQMFPLVREVQWPPGVLEGHGARGSQARQRYQEHPVVERCQSRINQSIITLKGSLCDIGREH